MGRGEASASSYVLQARGKIGRRLFEVPNLLRVRVQRGRRRRGRCPAGGQERVEAGRGRARGVVGELLHLSKSY